MTLHDDRTDTTIALTAAGVTVLVDARAGRLPAVVHWGHELPRLDAATAAALITAAGSVVGSNNVEPVPRVSVLPEHHTGWTGRPGLRGSRGGRGWSPGVTPRSITVDGAPASGFVAAGAAVVEILAGDDEVGLELRLLLELLPSGLLRARAALRNVADDVYQVDDLVLALPVPAE